MKTLPAVLSPFIRSDALGAVLAETMLHPDRELTVTDLARRADISVPLAHKEVGRLVEAGVLADRREGNHRYVRVDRSHPLLAPMTEIVAATYGPVPVLRDLLADVPGVSTALLYGSWAARRAGVGGPPPQDVDVLVVGTASRSDLADLAAAARERIGVVVNVHRVATEDWGRPDGNPFLETVRSRPSVVLVERGDGAA
ncbi:winged helix-turn-helix domain-containing protein [Cellulomonas triticagri]|uniref:ArsR family transcriptional regulator n=1 Tax=Cellulomonas triticagri TaxID=2483352 RepID=A0A3M2JGN2_9CELL|nr:winged helix-turn-helix domain-containing protein [Cellulomonas triticagri]RMI13197.1 ArsR family transcriptional regulator [Cellulomonas triticagri]